MDPEEIFEQKMMELLEQKQQLLIDINLLLEKFNQLEIEEDDLETKEFLRTGSITFSADFTIDVTYEDLVNDLIKKTQPKNIKPG